MNFVVERQDIEILSGNAKIKGIFALPERAFGLVLFVHGSGSSRFSPRNSFVARILEEAGFATLLMDLLTSEEESDRENVFNIRLLSSRLKDVIRWALKDSKTKNLPIGYFGASTGAAAALRTAAELPENIKAVVSRGGRPDLAEEYLSKVSAPTLLIVGGEDEPVISFNKAALENLGAEKRLVIIPGATHLFEEPGALEKVARITADWFTRHLKLK